jgi:hypothetical protein
MKRIPIVATLVVLAAVALMIALGVWQLHRLSWKEGLIARYQAAMNQPVLDWHDGVPLGAKVTIAACASPAPASMTRNWSAVATHRANQAGRIGPPARRPAAA